MNDRYDITRRFEEIERRLADMDRRIAALEKDSHPPKPVVGPREFNDLAARVKRLEMLP